MEQKCYSPRDSQEAESESERGRVDVQRCSPQCQAHMTRFFSEALPPDSPFLDELIKGLAH